MSEDDELVIEISMEERQAIARQILARIEAERNENN
jgi:hypothetical protein